MDILEKLFKLQQEVKAPKSQFNSHGNYNYRNNEDILEAVKPILSNLKAIIVQSDEVIQVGNRNYVKATSKLVCVESKEEYPATASACEAEQQKGFHPAQITGSSSSYARKYSLNGLLAIDDSKDSDTTNNGKDQKKDKKTPATEIPPIVDKFYKLVGSKNWKDFKESVMVRYKESGEKISIILEQFEGDIEREYIKDPEKYMSNSPL